MKVFRFIFVFLITGSLFYFLNKKVGELPPIGKLLDPVNGFWQNSEQTRPDLASEITLEGVSQPVDVKYDDRLVPHVFARNSNDLYFAQGYVTAQFRLWQMEMQTSAAAGRLSEVIGDKTLEYDRKQRRKGMVFGAKNSLEMMMKDSATSRMLKAYTNGINAYINTLSYKKFPLEYKLLDYSPEQWTPLKTALLLKYMAEDLSGSDSDLEYTNALKLLGRETFDLLFPDNPSKTPDPVIPQGTKWNAASLLPAKVQISFPQDFVSSMKRERPDPDNGSNNWAVGKNKSGGGGAFLANDPHLTLNLPSIWFEIQLSDIESNTYGASLPGAPGVIIGFNDSIAWGETNARMDVVDWYHINFKDQSRKEYLYDSQWVKSEQYVEEIKVRGAKTYYDTVIYTVHGPVMYDESYPIQKGKVSFAIRWTAHQQSNELKTIYLLNRGKNYADFINALSTWYCPAQNFAFASAKGDVGLYVAGKFPLKGKEQGKFLMNGEKPDQLWNTYIPFEQNPQVYNPPRGFISSANQQPVDSTYPYYIFDAEYEYYRNRRINSVLTGIDTVKLEDIIKLQNDNFNLQAFESVPFMLSYLDTTMLLTKEQQEFYNILKSWDYVNSPESAGAPIYKEWFDQLYPMIWDEFISDSAVYDFPNRFNTLKLLKNRPDLKVFDVLSTPETESGQKVTHNAFNEAVSNLSTWKKQNNRPLNWANFKATSIHHLLKLPPLGVFNIVTGGGQSVVNATKERHGPSWKMVVQLGNDFKAYGVYPGGQSGNPGSRFYSNFIDKWAEGKYFELLFLKSKDQQNGGVVFSQQLKTANP